MSGEFVTIAEFAVGCDAYAHIAKLRLESEGIKAMVLGENLLITSPYCPYKVIELKVSSEDAERAKKILNSNNNSDQEGLP